MQIFRNLEREVKETELYKFVFPPPHPPWGGEQNQAVGEEEVGIQGRRRELTEKGKGRKNERVGKGIKFVTTLYTPGKKGCFFFTMREHFYDRPLPSLPSLLPLLGTVTSEGITCNMIAHRHFFWTENVFFLKIQGSFNPFQTKCKHHQLHLITKRCLSKY